MNYGKRNNLCRTASTSRQVFRNSEKGKSLLFNIIFTFLFPVSLFAESVEPKNNLVIWTKDGIEVVYDLLKKPQINFTETELLITGDGIEVN